MKRLVFLILIGTFIVGCKKEKTTFDNNDVPNYEGISTLQVENYVNRLYIDLIGREPLDTEMSAEVNALETADLNKSARRSLVEKLQLNQDSIGADSSYFVAYHRKLYEDTKARLLEGVSDAFIEQEHNLFEGFATADSLNGNFVGYELNRAQAERLQLILDSPYKYRAGEITIQEMYGYMLNCSIYDNINMNTFNFINASFDNMFFRFPTQDEFDQAFLIIENNEPGQLFGSVGQTKGEYIDILTGSSEFTEGLVTWAFQSLLSRDPSTNERFQLINELTSNNNLPEIQTLILITDEYAGF